TLQFKPLFVLYVCICFAVCVGFLGRLYNSLVIRHTELSPELVEEGLIRACAEATGKENRLCYYLGASSDAAAKVTGEVSRPLSAHVPVRKICQRLQRRDGQICELRYGRSILFSTGAGTLCLKCECWS
uniref:Mesencephalic astrocyte-derived neurotrophic factor-like n=1 Tax=Sinocyclocheilus grahami TaxID=75366 RepID=A0A672K9H6_SINGR